MNRTLLKQALIKFTAGIILVALLLFIPAGSSAYWQGWVLMAVLFGRAQQVFSKYCRKYVQGTCCGAGIINNELGRDPRNGDVYIFVSRSRKLIKLLHFDKGCFNHRKLQTLQD